MARAKPARGLSKLIPIQKCESKNNSVTQLLSDTFTDQSILDGFPSFLVHHLSTLSEQNSSGPVGASQSSESLAIGREKRLKTSASDQTSCIATSIVELSRICDANDIPSSISCCKDVELVLGLSISDGEFHIVHRGKTSMKRYHLAIPLDYGHDTVGATAADILEVGCSSEKREEPGAIWTSVDVEMRREHGSITLKFNIQLFWRHIVSSLYPFRSKAKRELSQDLIDTYFPTMEKQQVEKASAPMDFYEAAYVPPKDDPIAASIETPRLDSTLYPYQKRTLSWMLAREGVRWNQSMEIVEDIPENDGQTWVNTFRAIQDAEGNSLFLSDVYNLITADTSPFNESESSIKGGILAEEMGLGKTLEILGLILLHPKPESAGFVSDGQVLTSSGTTLIVAPESLRAQWISEISTHAPSLRVKHYQGCRKLSNDEALAMIRELSAYDIVVTTYSVLRAELHFAKTPPKRDLRNEPAYERTKSPLVQISWWRLCLDEAQMIENGYNSAAEVARSIPRVNAWGITGTPVKDSVNDLYGLLLFLGYSPYCYAPHVWEALLNSHRDVFQRIFKAISLRHTKAMVRDELSIPPQKRFVVSMPFTAVEEQHYQSLFREMTEECNLDNSGHVLTDEWKPEDYEEEMRKWLIRLRQTALHPEVGVENRRALGRSLGNTKAKPMRTVEEVLDVMLEQSQATIKSEEREWLSRKLIRGQMYENGPRVKEASQVWEEVMGETSKLVEEARMHVRTLAVPGSTENAQAESFGDIIATELTESENEEEEEGETTSTKPKSILGEAKRRLRTTLELHHRAVFFCANASFQIREDKEMTEPDSARFNELKKLEDEGYDKAKMIRREILGGHHRRATRMMNKIGNKAKNQDFCTIPELIPHPGRGIESGSIVDSAEILYGELNQQANALDELREKTVELLMKSLIDEEEDVETTGEEMGESAKVQDELDVHIQVLRAMVADRQDAVTGQPNELIKHEVEVAVRWAKNGDGPAPAMLIALMKMRDTLKPKLSQTSLRGLISDFRGVHSRLHREGEYNSQREVSEMAIASSQLKTAQTALTEQNKVGRELEAEVEMFTTAMNRRLDYYRQLQEVSDGVLPYEGSRTELAEERMKAQEELHRKKMLSAQAKHRYRKSTAMESNEYTWANILQF